MPLRYVKGLMLIDRFLTWHEQILRSRRIFTKTAVHSTPKAFLFIPVVASNGDESRPVSLNKHLVRVPRAGWEAMISLLMLYRTTISSSLTFTTPRMATQT